jgi:hypothetical protein
MQLRRGGVNIKLHYREHLFYLQGEDVGVPLSSWLYVLNGIECVLGLSLAMGPKVSRKRNLCERVRPVFCSLSVQIAG